MISLDAFSGKNEPIVLFNVAEILMLWTYIDVVIQ